MQKYEFCSIRRRWNKKSWRWWLVSYTQTGELEARLKRDKAKGDRSANDASARIIAQLGLDGWEVTAALGGELFFQRPIE